MDGKTRRSMSFSDIAGADLSRHLGRKLVTAKDPRYASSPAFSFGRRNDAELNNMSANNVFFCKSGTHRCAQGQKLLDDLRRRDDKSFEKLCNSGQQWKSLPGPGAYRIARYMGLKQRDQEIDLGATCTVGSPSWGVGTSLRPRPYSTMGGFGHGLLQHEGRLRQPTPSNIAPGPGRYFQDFDIAPSNFADFMRPQNRQVV